MTPTVSNLNSMLLNTYLTFVFSLLTTEATLCPTFATNLVCQTIVCRKYIFLARLCSLVMLFLFIFLLQSKKCENLILHRNRRKEVGLDGHAYTNMFSIPYVIKATKTPWLEKDCV